MPNIRQKKKARKERRKREGKAWEITRYSWGVWGGGGWGGIVRSVEKKLYNGNGLQRGSPATMTLLNPNQSI